MNEHLTDKSHVYIHTSDGLDREIPHREIVIEDLATLLQTLQHISSFCFWFTDVLGNVVSIEEATGNLGEPRGVNEIVDTIQRRKIYTVGEKPIYYQTLPEREGKLIGYTYSAQPEEKIIQVDFESTDDRVLADSDEVAV